MKNPPPGLLRAAANPDVVMMVCTAGHVDHGKTALVKLLTGCNTDRLKAEQERGLTIELGFAPCVLGGDTCVGIVDVPGHEKFVRNMVAGVSGIGMAILVIAADDGIMPQTIEHCQIMELLGVRQGIIALTKTDLVTPERVAEVAEDIRIFIDGTFLEGAPIYPLSSETGEGVFEFYDGLVEKVRGLVRASRQGVFRMPIERSFVQKGFGTVVTGIPVDGTVATGDEFAVVPGGSRCRVRGLQRFLRDASEGGHGQCLAVNASEFAKAPPGRGQVLCVPGYLDASTHFCMFLKALPGLDKPIENAQAVKFHTGTAEQMGKLYLLEEKTLAPGESAFASVVLDEPVAAAVHDRFILRRPSPSVTIGGGSILAVAHGPVHKRRHEYLAWVKEYQSLFEGLDPSSPEGMEADLTYILAVRRPAGASLNELAKAIMAPEDTARTVLEGLEDVRLLGKDCFIHKTMFEARREEARARVDRAVKAGQLSLNLSALREAFASWPGPLWDAVLASLVEEGEVSLRGSKLVLTKALGKLPQADMDLMGRIFEAYEESGFSSPRPEELCELLGAPEQKISRLLEHLYNEGSLVRVGKNVVLSANTLKRAQDIVIATVKEKGALDSADFKYAIESTRKYALAILDYFDARRVTLRNGNLRRLAPGYEKNLVDVS